MMSTGACQRQRPTLHFWPMLDHHLDEIFKVNFVNVAAFVVSFGEFSDFLRVAVMVASLVYTVVKTIEAVKNLRK